MLYIILWIIMPSNEIMAVTKDEFVQALSELASNVLSERGSLGRLFGYYFHGLGDLQSSLALVYDTETRFEIVTALAKALVTIESAEDAELTRQFGGALLYAECWGDELFFELGRALEKNGFGRRRYVEYVKAMPLSSCDRVLGGPMAIRGPDGIMRKIDPESIANLLAGKEEYSEYWGHQADPENKKTESIETKPACAPQLVAKEQPAAKESKPARNAPRPRPESIIESYIAHRTGLFSGSAGKGIVEKPQEPKPTGGMPSKKLTN
jgi:hypothetical protein